MSNDYFMRQVQDIARFLAHAVFARNPGTIEIEIMDETGALTGEYLLLQHIHQLVQNQQLNAAENALFDALAENPRPEYLPVALEFYQNLAGMSDEMLAACHFSREEIGEGLAEVARIYGVTPPQSTVKEEPT